MLKISAAKLPGINNTSKSYAMYNEEELSWAACKFQVLEFLPPYSYLRFTQALLGGSPKNWTWHSSLRSYTPSVGWLHIKLGHQGCPSSFAHNIPQSSIFVGDPDFTFDCFGEFLSFLVDAFSPLIGEKPFALSFGEMLLFFSAVSPQTGEEGFLDFGVFAK